MSKLVLSLSLLKGSLPRWGPYTHKYNYVQTGFVTVSDYCIYFVWHICMQRWECQVCTMCFVVVQARKPWVSCYFGLAGMLIINLLKWSWQGIIWACVHNRYLYWRWFYDYWPPFTFPQIRRFVDKHKGIFLQISPEDEEYVKKRTEELSANT